MSYRFVTAWIMPAVMVSICACSSSPRHEVIGPRTRILPDLRQSPAKVVGLPAKKERTETGWTDETRSVTTGIERGERETWFRTTVRISASNAPVTIFHDANLVPDPAYASGLVYVCRGWADIDPPPDRELVISGVQRIRYADNIVTTRVFEGVVSPGYRYLPLSPLSERTLPTGTNDVVVAYEISAGSDIGPRTITVCLSPQFMTLKEQATQQETEQNADRLYALSDSAAMHRFARLYLDSASDYVQVHLPRKERVHCYLQAACIREWCRQMFASHPELGEAIRITPLRRYPIWHSTTMVTPRDGRSAQSYFDANEGVVLDTWRGDGGTRTRLLTLQEFRRFLCYTHIQK